jgi:hypothetical protein
MAETHGTVHTWGRGLLCGLWWPAGPELVSDHMAVPVQEIMDHGDTIHNLLYVFMAYKALYTKIYIRKYKMKLTHKLHSMICTDNGSKEIKQVCNMIC